MFKNTGKTIRDFAEFLFVTFAGILLLFCLITAINSIIDSEVERFFGVIFGCAVIILILWCIFSMMYGYGRIVECVEKIANNTTTKDKEESVKDSKKHMLELFKTMDLITEQEFNATKVKMASSQDLLILAKDKYESGQFTEEQYKTAKTKILNDFVSK